ncbi:MAG: PAS domain-containing protein, partial [Chloroflexota bacterium]
DDQVVLSGASIIDQERQTVNADGTRIWVSTTKVPLHDAQGTISGMVGISRNITARKQAEAVLQQERNLLRALIDAVPANVYIKDSQSRFVDANSETILKFGVKTASELIGKTDFDFFSPELAAKYFADEQAVLQSGQPLLNIEERTVDQRTQQQRWLLTTKAPVRNESGEVIGLVGVGLDITDRKQAEEALRANEAKLQTIFKLLPVGMSLINNERQIVEMNPAQERILGMTLDDIMTGKYLARQYFHGDGRPVLAGEYPSSRAMAEQRAIFDAEIGFLKEDGSTVWTTVSAAPLPEGQGLVMVMADMTERKQVEQERQRLYSALDMVAEGAQMISFDWRYLYLNDAAAHRARRTKAEMLGFTMLEIYPGIEQTPIFDVFQRCMNQRSAEHMENQFTFPDNHMGWFELHIQPIAEGLFIISTDVTERKQAEAQTLALAAEQQRGELLRAFITDVSHDFRTPLTIIGTSSFLIGKTTDPAKLTQYSQRIGEQIIRLRMLLENFVELARLEQQVSSLPFQSADLDSLVRTILEQTQGEVAGKHQKLEYRYDTSSTLVLGNPAALSQAITQVVVNAFHFTPNEGKIALRLYSEDENAVLEVTDTGIGIPADELSHIFESFYRVDNSRSTTTGGAGLGLSIAKRIIEMMKGHIEVESEVGVGSVFRIYLPPYKQRADTSVTASSALP